ncbi:MAG: PilZ domain-containing protein [Candidatus Omnitrophica bacterium]|nr:PilZ domain-containing protein [Candidatus Omnitrophota bacterium]MCB9748134.1 PilZ domain-containing protein [Candidatus Omnitrophota bacterium]
MSNVLEERRKFKRIEENHKVISSRYPSTGETSNDAIKDFCAGGAFINSKIRYEIGELIKLAIQIEGLRKYVPGFNYATTLTRSDPVVVLAKVVRSDIIRSGYTYGIGVSFVSIADRDKMAIDKYIKEKTKDNQ